MGTKTIGARPPSLGAYYVALGGVALLLLLLCCYCLYFCITKVAELSDHDSLRSEPRAVVKKDVRPTPHVQPAVRESASAMVALCKSLPAQTTAAPSVAPSAIVDMSSAPPAS